MQCESVSALTAISTSEDPRQAPNRPSWSSSLMFDMLADAGGFREMAVEELEKRLARREAKENCCLDASPCGASLRREWRVCGDPLTKMRSELL